MTEINYEEMTKQIMEGMNTSTSASSVGKNILKTKLGSTILGRFVLYKPNPKNSIHHYFHHGWKTNGEKYVAYPCLATSGESCPICSKSISMWKSNDNFLKESSKKIRRKENWLVNFYVIDDNENKANNGTVKMFRYGKQVKEIVDEAMSGADKSIYGTNIWKLNSGCSFRISVKANSDKKDAWPSYTQSKFLPTSDLSLSNEKMGEILDSAFDLKSIFEPMTYEELASELQKNFIDDLNKEQSIMDSGNKPSIMKYTTSNSTATNEKSNQGKSDTTKTESVKSVIENKSNESSEIDDLLSQLDS